MYYSTHDGSNCKAQKTLILTWDANSWSPSSQQSYNRKPIRLSSHKTWHKHHHPSPISAKTAQQNTLYIYSSLSSQHILSEFLSSHSNDMVCGHSVVLLVLQCKHHEWTFAYKCDHLVGSTMRSLWGWKGIYKDKSPP